MHGFVIVTQQVDTPSPKTILNYKNNHISYLYIIGIMSLPADDDVGMNSAILA